MKKSAQFNRVLGAFIMAYITDTEYATGWKAIPQKYLSPTNRRIKKWKDQLIEEGFLECDNFFQWGSDGKRGRCYHYQLDWSKTGDYLTDLGEGDFPTGFLQVLRMNGAAVEGFSIKTKEAMDAVMTTVNEEYVKSLCKDVEIEDDGFRVGAEHKTTIQVVFPDGKKEYTFTVDTYKKWGGIIKKYKNKFIGFISQAQFNLWCLSKVVYIRLEHIAHIVRNVNPKYYLKFGESSNYREYTTITSLPTYLKEFLTCNGQPTAQIDITSSQPTMLVNEVLKSCNESEQTENEQSQTRQKYQEWGATPPSSTIYVSPYEASILANLVTNGKFYEYVQEKGGLDTRAEAKLMTLLVFYDKQRDNKANRLFNRLFPGLMAFVNDFKARHGYKKLSVSLQIMEAKMMEQVQNRLREAGYTVTGVHDSVICEARYEKEVYEIMVAEMKNHIEYFNV